MAELDLYTYLLRDMRYIGKTPDGANCFFSKARDYGEIGFKAWNLPEKLPYLEEAECICRYLKPKHDDYDVERSDYYIVKISDPYLDYLKSKRISISHTDFRRTGISGVRRPYFMVRGKSVDHREMKYLLKNELAVFREKSFFENKQGWDSKNRIYWSLETAHFGKLIPDQNGSSGGWLWDTGEIGGHGWEDKYPEFAEYMPRWLEAALLYPFLDMVVGYTLYAEIPCYWCPLKEYYLEAEDEERDTAREYPFSHPSDDHRFVCRMQHMKECEAYFREDTGSHFVNGAFTERTSMGTDYASIVYPTELAMDVVMTVRIHDGSLDVLTGEEALRLFQEYDAEYGFRDTWRYAGHSFDYYHNLLQETLVTEQTLRECFRDENMDEDRCIDYLVQEYGVNLKEMQRGTPRLI